MNPRSIYYRNQLDFDELSRAYPSLRPYVHNSQINFKNAAAARELTKALLKRDFELDIKLLDDRLCPPVVATDTRLTAGSESVELCVMDTRSSRYNTTASRHSGSPRIERDKRLRYRGRGVVHISTSRMQAPSLENVWIGSLECARENIDINNLQSQITLLTSCAGLPLLQLNLFNIDRLDFCMCNPPFYESADELYKLAREKGMEPFSSCTGSPVEMCTAGGEVGFISRLIDESLALKERVRWYSAMLGKLSSVSSLVQKLRDEKIENYALTEFVQGTTKRWGIAWSFLACRPRKDVSCPTAFALRNFLPKTPQYICNAPLSASFTISIIQRFLTSIRKTQYAWDNDVGVSAVTGDVWSRSARRHPQDTMEEQVRLGVRINIKDAQNGSQVTIEWRIGTDVMLFESFCGKIKGVVQQSHQSSNS